MRQRIFIFAFCLLAGFAATTTSLASAQEEDSQGMSLEEFCSTSDCRKNQQIKFLTDGEPVDVVLDLYWPVVQGEEISLLPGDKVFIEAEIVDGVFTNLKQVEAVTNKEKTIIFDFSQMEGKVDMMLSVKNPFSETMKFHLDMIDFEGNPHQTSSCPVFPGAGAYEHWPHAIPEIIVSNIRVIESSDTVSCIY